MKFLYEYDYGSTTALVLKVVALREQGLPKGAVQLLARNEAPRVKLPAVWHPARHQNLYRMRVEWGGLALWKRAPSHMSVATRCACR